MEGRPAATASYSGRRPGRAGHRKWGGGGGHDCAARQEDEHAVRRVQGGREARECEAKTRDDVAAAAATTPAVTHGTAAQREGVEKGGRGGRQGVLWPPRHPPRVQAGGDGRPLLGGSGPAGQHPEERAVCPGPPSHPHWTIEITVADPPRWMAGDRRRRRRHASSRATPFPPALCRPTGAGPARGSPLGVCRQKYRLERGRGPITAARRLSFGRTQLSLGNCGLFRPPFLTCLFSFRTAGAVAPSLPTTPKESTGWLSLKFSAGGENRGGKEMEVTPLHTRASGPSPVVSASKGVSSRHPPRCM